MDGEPARETPTVTDQLEAAPVLGLLHAAQERRGYLHEDDIIAIAAAAKRSPAELYGAVTAYPGFRLSAGPVAAAVCTGPACRFRGATRVREALPEAREAHCLGLCDQPVAVWTVDGPRIADASEPSQLKAPRLAAPTVGAHTSAFFGDDDPFDAVRIAQTWPPERLVALVMDSGLQGRGGAGFLAGQKWTGVRAAPSDRKVIICNADESEPGTFKDRAILDREPRRMLAGMALAAQAIAADLGVVYLRDEYRPQYERLLNEIARLRDEGMLEDDFQLVVRRGGGLYICGEETALLNSIEGRRPTPRDRPPYPVSWGLFGMPTLIHNVETLAALPAIVTRGPGWHRDAGRPKLYCVSGDVPRPGVYELPMTVTARELVERAGGAIDRVKVFTLGGLSGGLLPASFLNLRLDFDAPRRHDAHLGSGGVVVLGPSRCAVRFVAEAMRFFAEESCGKCLPCRIGTTRLRERLDMVARLDDVDASELAEVADLVSTGSACGLGPAAALMARHLLAHFGEEVAAHRRGTCPTGECLHD